jgi:hypothetical protein
LYIVQVLTLGSEIKCLLNVTDNSYVVSHVEFQNPENNAKARRLQSSTCHAFQIALGCPVELKLSLAHPPAIVTEVKNYASPWNQQQTYCLAHLMTPQTAISLNLQFHKELQKDIV